MTNSEQIISNPPASPQPQSTPKQSNGLGVAALVLGILAFIGSFIPFLNFGTGFIAFIGIVLGIIALVLKGRAKKAAIAGTILSVLALILSIVLAIAYTAAFATAVKNVGDSQTAAANKSITLVYDIAGDSTDAAVLYSTYNDGKSGTEQATGQQLPFSKTITVKKGGDFSFNSYTLSGTNGQTGTTISCKITLDGKVIAEQTSTGQFATVMCSGSGKN